MKLLNLAPRHLETLRLLFSEHLREGEVLAYGSRVSGTCHDGSDLDLVIRNPLRPESPVPGTAQLRRAVAESAIPILVDLLEWNRLNSTFRREILRQCSVIWSAEADFKVQTNVVK